MGSGDPLKPGQWYQSDTYYQILEVNPSAQEGKNTTTSILAKKRGTGDNQKTEPDSFDEFELDKYTIKNLKDYPRKGDANKLSSYLPFPGVIFPDNFLYSFPGNDTQVHLSNFQTELGNFYCTMRTLLYSRKVSQLIAKTWYCYLQATETKLPEGKSLWKKFTEGNWQEIAEFRNDSEDLTGLYILDGLIAREIFLFAGGDAPDNPYSEADTLYLKKTAREPVESPRFLILPSSKSWQGICLALLLAGQAYYKIDGQYHQIAQPILSTGEITFKYSLEVDWNRFNGEIKELIIGKEKPWVAYHAVLPYPSIPTHADPGEIAKWAKAEDDSGDFPFYNKTDEGKYLMDVEYFRSPYPYIPLSCS